jgi:hypothetical protein
LHAAASNRMDRNALGRGLTRYTADDLRLRGDYTRRDFRYRGFYTADWYRRYPRAWVARRWAYEDLWRAANWEAMLLWLSYGNMQSMYYDYGNNVIYQNGSVSMNGRDMGTTAEYYQQAADLAGIGAAAKPADDREWMPLGVFAMTHEQQSKANLILQLAVDKAGIIRGNYTATLTNDTQQVQGSVDKKTQRAAWTIGDNTDNVFETGIFNLTKDEVPILVHLGKDKTEQWVLVRLNHDTQSDPAGTDNPVDSGK